MTVDFVTADVVVRVLNHVSFHVGPGEIVGIVGESGSGKTTLGLAMLRLLDSPPAHYVSGSVDFDGTNVLEVEESQLPHLRGTGMNMVFQESLVALNPVYTVEAQIRACIEVQERMRKLSISKDEKKRRMVGVLRGLSLDNPEAVMRKYPHELSGGMRQRISIATAIVEGPKLLILDEPTTGLDAYVQNKILQVLKKLNTDLGITMVMITHDLAVASQVCDRLYVMYAGRIMESGSSQEILVKPLHPYSQSLLAAVPVGFDTSSMLPVPAGEPPDLKRLPEGCKFNPRCPYVKDRCKVEEPDLFARAGRMVSCWLHSPDSEGGDT